MPALRQTERFSNSPTRRVDSFSKELRERHLRAFRKKQEQKERLRQIRLEGSVHKSTIEKEKKNSLLFGLDESSDSEKHIKDQYEVLQMKKTK